MSKKKEISIRSGAAEYLTFVAATGEQANSIEMRYEDENIWLTQKMMAELLELKAQLASQQAEKNTVNDDTSSDTSAPNEE